MLAMPLMLGAWYVTLFTLMFVMVCLFLILVVLIQKPRGSGLTGAFGGAGGGAGSVFGSKTGDVLTWVTVVGFALFLSLSMLLTWTAKPGKNSVAPILNTGGTDNSDNMELIPKGKSDGTSGKTPEVPKPETTAPETPKPETKLPEAPKPETKAPEAPKTDGK